jgi:hypothetical protein
MDGPYRVSELKSMLAGGLITLHTLVAAGFVESYVDEDGAEIQVGWIVLGSGG